ncbi:unnamed protein product, partial [Ectocarpus sp. 8 AP-2014]
LERGHEAGGIATTIVVLYKTCPLKTRAGDSSDNKAQREVFFFYQCGGRHDRHKQARCLYWCPEEQQSQRKPREKAQRG